MSTDSAPSPVARLTSLDAYRGFAMLLMASEGLGFGPAARFFPGSGFWRFLAYQTDHAPWRGCAVWDLIQPSFMFMVGVAMPYSLASRRAKGDSFSRLLRHALVRSLTLVLLGVFLRSVGRPLTNWTFEDVLSQIGLGYPFLFLLAWTRPRTQAVAAGVILLGVWAAFALYPLPPAGMDTVALGVPADWSYRLHGFAQHWDKHSNIGAHFDQWFLNLFPRTRPYVVNDGGYLTLSFVPSLATMIFGMLVAGLVRSGAPSMKIARTLCTAGVVGLVVGFIFDITGLCPSVKRIWTPAWAIFSTGWTCVFLGTFYAVIDVKGRKGWTSPLLVVGMNSIAMYCLVHLISGFIVFTLKTHISQDIFKIFGHPFVAMLERATVLAVLWLVCLWMYRRKIFLRI